MIPIGFLGLGIMGRPMAANLARAGADPLVWNRSPAAVDAVCALGARAAPGPAEVLAGSEVIFLMLKDEEVTDRVLERGTPQFAASVRGRTLVQMGTTAPEYTAALGRAVHAAGGEFVEAPVSGSRGPAESGELVAMLAGPPEALARVRPLLAAMCGAVYDCGAVPNATLMKLAVNTFLITMVTGLVEAFHLAQGFGLDLDTFVAVHDAGPMASRVSVRKAAKLLAGDFAVEAALADVFKNNQLITAAAQDRSVSAPLMAVCHDLYRDVVGAGLGAQDMAAVLNAYAGATNR